MSVGFACSGSPPETHTSGSRLRAVVMAGDDGSRSFLHHWHDLELGVDCYRRRAADGIERCLPVGYPSYVYGDTECTRPVWPVGYPQVPSDDLYLLRSQTLEDCQTSTQVFLNGGVEAVTLHWFDSDGACQPHPLADAKVYVAGAVVPPERFAELRVTAADSGERITAVLEESPDGARRAVGTYDRDLGVEVRAWELAPELQRPPLWLPRSMAWTSRYYADPGCTEQLGVSTSCLPPRFIEWRRQEGPYRLYESGGPIEPEPEALFELEGGACREVSDPDASRTYYRIGPEVELSLLAEARSGVADRGSRLSRRAYVTDDGYASQRMRDYTDHGYLGGAGLPCHRRVAGDGELRCLHSVGRADWFIDADCKQRVARIPRDRELPDDLGLGRVSAWERGNAGVEIDGRLHLYRIREAVDASAGLFKLTHHGPDGRCVEDRYWQGEATYHRVVGEVPPEAFVALEPLIE